MEDPTVRINCSSDLKNVANADWNISKFIYLFHFQREFLGWKTGPECKIVPFSLIVEIFIVFQVEVQNLKDKLHQFKKRSKESELDIQQTNESITLIEDKTKTLEEKLRNSEMACEDWQDKFKVDYNYNSIVDFDWLKLDVFSK